MFQLAYADGWDKYFNKFDKLAQERIRKKILQAGFLIGVRHLKHGLAYFILETGQYRVAYEEQGNIRIIHFAGAHKQYEEWLRQQ